MKLIASRWMVPGVAAAALLAGCAVGPDYERPLVAEPQEFRGQSAADATSLADLPWWELFQDATLKGLIQEALSSNYDVQLAAARVQEARARKGEAKSRFFPSIGYGFGVQESHLNPGQLGIESSAPTTSDVFYGVLSASWEIDIWGRIRRLNEAARASLLATEEAQRGVWLTLVSDVAQAYFELLALDVRLQIARNSTDAFQGTYDFFQDRLQFGVASKLQTSRAEGALGAAQATIPEIQSQVVAKENQISILLGRNPGPVPRGTPMYEQPVVPTVPVGLPSTLLQRRPDLRQAEEQMVRANALIGVAKAEFFPKLNLTGLLGTASSDISGVTSASNLVWQVAAGLAGPVFQGGRILENYRGQIAVWEQTKAQYTQTVIAAFKEVSDSLTALGKLSEAEVGQERSVKALEASVGYATDRYRYGLASYFEVLEAQQQLFPAQATLAQIRRDRLLAYVRLYKALGGGWSLADTQWKDQTKGSSG